MLHTAETKTYYALRSIGDNYLDLSGEWVDLKNADLRLDPQYWVKYLEEKPIEGARIVSVSITTTAVVLFV